MAEVTQRAEQQQESQKTLLGTIISTPFQFLGVMFGSLIGAIIVEWVCLYFFWPDAGWKHAQAMFEYELSWLSRINISEWRNNKQSKQYISFIKGKGGRKVSDYFRDFIGCQEGVDSPSETRTLLKAFSDFVESEDMAEEQAREKTETLVDYATSQARIGEPMTLDALSELMDDQQPRAFYDYIRNKDYGLSPEIPADKRTLNQFRRFTGRAEGLSISFEAHLLGSRIEYDEERDTLQISSLPTQLRDQLKRRKAQIGE
ncbi:nucleoid-associated protein [Pseudomonas aeruginosa]